ncbi:MAG: ATP-binding protein [bacterium]
MEYRQDIAFINRKDELSQLYGYIADRPKAILFLHGPKSSGKTTLLYRFFAKASKEEKLDIKFINLREILLSNYRDFLQSFFQIDYTRQNADIKQKREYDLKVFKLSIETLKGLESKSLDPFVVMKKELLKSSKSGIKPVIIIDELQALDEIYLNGGRGLITELFNFFVAMTKESHIAHIIISSSDGYFIETVFTDSKLKKCSEFFEINYLSKEDTFEWLLNLYKYSKIKEYTLTSDDAVKIWEVVGGSMWEIQSILSKLFHAPLDDVLAEYKLRMRGIIDDYIGFDQSKADVLRLFVEDMKLSRKQMAQLISKDMHTIEDLLRDMVKNNVLYYDPTLALFYPQGRSLELGIKLYFEEDRMSSFNI